MADNAEYGGNDPSTNVGYEARMQSLIPRIQCQFLNHLNDEIPDVPSTSIKLMLFPFSLEGSARIWLEKEPPRSILTWDDLVSKFINQFFPLSKTTNLRNEITRFQQRFDESFYEAWDRFNDTFYNALNANDQDSLNSAAGRNFLDKMPRECLKIIESKSKVRNSRNNAVVAKVSSSSSMPGISPDVAALTTEVSELKNMMKIMLIDKQKAQALVPVKVSLVSQAAAANFNQGNTNSRPPMVANQIRPPDTTINYNDMTANQIDVVELACEEYFHEVLGFSDVIAEGQIHSGYDPDSFKILSALILIGDSNFLLLEEANAFLALADDPTSPEVDESYYDLEGDILILEALLNSDPSPPSNQGNYLPEIRKELMPNLQLMNLPSVNEKTALIKVLKSIKRAIAWKLSDIKGINLEFYSYKILMEEDYEPAVQHQRRVNPKIHDVIKKEVEKLLDAGLIYPISDSPWVSPVHCVPKKGGMTVVTNDENELVPTRLVTGWRVCIDYRKLNEATRKDHFPLPFMDQMLERLAGNEYYCFLDGFSGYFQIPIDPKDQEKTTFTCPYGTFAYRRMPFGLCNAPGTFQRCMMAIFHDMIEKTMEVFMDDFSVFGNSFSTCLSNLEKKCLNGVKTLI
ncbi:reverse transcriptase domain-containing protein [Tanacetum coccineum]